MIPTVTAPNDPNLTVTIRPDDIEFRCGNSTDKNIPVMNLAPYAASVTDANGTTPYSIPQHDRFARWLHPLTSDIIINDHKAIVANGWFPPYGQPGKKTPPKPTNKYTGPLSTAGISTNMGATGERPDIGLEPEWEAYALATGDFGPCLEAAKGFDSMPIHIIDERTGRYWDLTKYLDVTLFWGQSNITDFIASAAGGQWSMNIPHHPANYLSYLATKKLRYLENTQALAIYGFLVTNWYTSITGKQVVNLAEERGAGWHFRSLLMAWRATVEAEKDFPGGLPKPLMSSAFFKQLIDWQQELFDLWVSDPANDVFRQFPDVTGFRPWQNDYFLESLLLAAYFFPNSWWSKTALWAMKNPIDRLAGHVDGSPPCHIGPYQFPTGPNMPPEGDNNWPKGYKASDFFSTMAAAFTNYANLIIKNGGGWNMTVPQIQAIIANPDGLGHIISWDPYPTLTLRSLMAIADFLDKNGYLPLKTTFGADWDFCVQRITNYALDWESQAPNNVIPFRVSAVSNVMLSPPPVQLPPSNPPPVTQPPTKLPATIPGILKRAANLKTLVGA